MYLNLKLLSQRRINPADLPQFTGHPLDVTVNEFESATMSGLAVSGDGSPLTYRWQINYDENADEQPPEVPSGWLWLDETSLPNGDLTVTDNLIDFGEANRIEDATYRLWIMSASMKTSIMKISHVYHL